MEDFKKYKDDKRQSDAEVEALQLLWSGTIRTFLPNQKTIADWLRLGGYAEVTRAINDTIRLWIKYNGNLRPGQLLRYTEQQITKSLLRKTAVPA